MEVIAPTIDLGSERNLPEIRQRALDVGAKDAKVAWPRYLYQALCLPALAARFTRKNIHWLPPSVALNCQNAGRCGAWIWRDSSGGYCTGKGERSGAA